MSVSTMPKQPSNKKLFPLIGGHLDGLSVDASEIVEGVFSCPIVGKMHDYGNGERELVWMKTKNAYCDVTVFYKLDGNALYFSHREPG